MTAESLCKKSFFREYLFGRLRAQKVQLIVSGILNLLMLPLLSSAMLFNADQLHRIMCLGEQTEFGRDFFNYSMCIAFVCCIALLGMALVGAAFSFDYYGKRELCDTFGALPLTHRQRFWGDFLSGYAANVLTLVPCALTAIGISGGVQSVLDKTAANDRNVAAFMTGLSLTLFIAYTFAYIFSVLSASCCGRTSYAIVFSVALALAVPFVGINAAHCFVNSAAGLMWESCSGGISVFFPPFGLFFGELAGMAEATDLNLDMVHEGASIDYYFNWDFALAKPLDIAVTVLIAAALTALAYYLAKKRRQEYAGRPFVHIGLFHTVSLGTCAAIILWLSHSSGKRYLFGAAVGTAAAAVALIIFELVRRAGVRQIPKTALRFAVTAACCFGAVILLNKTGGFGAQYRFPEADNVEYITVQIADDYYAKREYKITDRNDISELIDSQSATLRKYSDNLMSGTAFMISYNLKNGKSVERGYSYDGSPLVIMLGDHRGGIEEMMKNVYRLSSYPKLQSEFLTDGTIIGECRAYISGIYGEIWVVGDDISEFSEILAEDIVAGYDVDTENIGIVQFNLNDSDDNCIGKVSVPILTSYAKTLEFLNALADEMYEASDDIAVTVSCYDYDELSFEMRAIIWRSDLNDPVVKEILSLLKKSDDKNPKPDDWFESVFVYSSDGASYYVTKENAGRILELVMEFLENSAA